MSERTHPKRIGPYRILELKGEGAWGLVYLAEELEPVRRRVAIKVLKIGLDSEEILARFDAERQAMAMMSHPNIAQVLDAGATDQGLSYFVMEYVEGQSISTYCDHHRLTVRERVALFVQVVEAVQHAHQKGIIHRDIKPSNVLVASMEGRAVPKVIDFGVAKALHYQLTDKTLHTVHGRFIGTPGYVSPEQALGGIDVDTTTDIYALGAVLYELLAGTPPLDIRLLGVPEMLRALWETDPVPLSGRFTQLGERAAEVAEARNVDPKALKRVLSGDLTWIVAQALDRDRERRYQAASELAADLERYLRGEAVLAGPPGTAYRLKRFVTRHKWPVGTATLAAVLLGFFSAAMGVQLRRVDAEAARANLGEAAAEQVANFMVGLFEMSDLHASLGDTITAREILDRGSERIRADLAEQPVLQARLTRTMGEAYSGLGLAEPAVALLEQSVALREAAGDSLALAESLISLGEAHLRARDVQSAGPIVRRALAIREELLDPDDLLVADALRAVGRMILGIRGRREETYATQVRRLEGGAEILRRALAIREAALGPDDPLVAQALADLGFALRLNPATFEDAVPLTERAVAIAERAYGPNHPDLRDPLFQLAQAYNNTRRYSEAFPILLRLVEIQEAVLGPDHPELASTLGLLSAASMRVGDLPQARAWAERAVRASELFSRTEPRYYTYTVLDVARINHAEGRFDEAEAHYRSLLRFGETALGSDDRLVLEIRLELGNTLRDAGRLAEADTIYAHVLEHQADPDAPGWDGDFSRTIADVARLRMLQGRMSEAEEAYRRAVEVLWPTTRRFYGVSLSTVLEELSTLVRRQGRVAEADSLAAQADSVLRSRGF